MLDMRGGGRIEPLDVWVLCLASLMGWVYLAGASTIVSNVVELTSAFTSPNNASESGVSSKFGVISDPVGDFDG